MRVRACARLWWQEEYVYANGCQAAGRGDEQANAKARHPWPAEERHHREQGEDLRALVLLMQAPASATWGSLVARLGARPLDATRCRERGDVLPRSPCVLWCAGRGLHGVGARLNTAPAPWALVTTISRALRSRRMIIAQGTGCVWARVACHTAPHHSCGAPESCAREVSIIRVCRLYGCINSDGIWNRVVNRLASMRRWSL